MQQGQIFLMHHPKQRSQTQKKHVQFHLYEIVEKAKLIYSERKQINGCLELLMESYLNCECFQGWIHLSKLFKLCFKWVHYI